MSNNNLLVRPACMPPEGHDPTKAALHVYNQIKDKIYNPNYPAYGIIPQDDEGPIGLDDGKPMNEITFKIENHENTTIYPIKHFPMWMPNFPRKPRFYRIPYFGKRNRNHTNLQGIGKHKRGLCNLHNPKL